MKIAVLVSGGVDSSLALALLVQQGYDVTAYYLKIWLEDEFTHLASCPWEEDLQYVQATCTQLGVPLQVLSFQREYWDIVVRRTIDAMRMGYTPNSDVWCNEYIKFGVFFEVLDASGHRFDRIATGHYAQADERNGVTLLRRSPDPIKDQTYFLCNLSREQRARALFPIGHLHKSEVRDQAKQLNLPACARADSQGICFLGNFKFRDFAAAHLGMQTGVLKEFETGNILGEHEGHWFYTSGQRQGIRLSGGPWYVVSKDPASNIVFISRSYHALEVERSQFLVRSMRWHDEAVREQSTFFVKVRHRAIPQVCTLTPVADGTYQVTLARPDQGIAPGQYAVFYDGDWCVASGVIS